jgi:hypothetical protein
LATSRVVASHVEHRLRLVRRRNARRSVHHEGRGDSRFVDRQLRLEQFELETNRAQVLAQQEVHVLKGQLIGRALGLGRGDLRLGAFGFLFGTRKDA